MEKDNRKNDKNKNKERERGKNKTPKYNKDTMTYNSCGRFY